MTTRLSDEDTIAAISTPIGEGGIGIVRLSGTRAVSIVDGIFESVTGQRVADQKSFSAQFGRIVSEKDGRRRVIDEALVLLMRSPKSYTREDVVEINAHGGSAVLEAVLEAVIRAGARTAAPGEFTKRAFLNGRLDLLQAEAVLDLISAKAERSRRWAASQLEGALSERVRRIKGELVQILSHLEASIDFPDDFPETESLPRLGEKLEDLVGRVEDLLSGSALGFLAKKGLKIVLWGRPNVGKSSLMNALARSNRVIVTPYPGTTRDVVEEEIQIGGFPVRLVDTAGIQDTDHPIEKEAVERSRRALQTADLALFVLDGAEKFHPDDQKLFDSLEAVPKILVVNKADLPRKLEVRPLRTFSEGTPVVESSCVLVEGVRALEEEIFRFMAGDKTGISDEAVVSSVRQKELLEKVSRSLKDAAGVSRGVRPSPELVAVDVRLAIDHLGALVGEVVTDDVLEVLFSQFCIGK